MFTAMIIDDEPLARKRVHDLLRSEPDIRVIAESGDGLDARQKVEVHNPDILFLDIKMPGLSGLQLSRFLSKTPAPPLIIFTTAYSEHAVDAFDINAVDYLMKPFDLERFRQALAKARSRLSRENPDAIGMRHVIEKLSGLVTKPLPHTEDRLAVKDGTHFRFFILHNITHMQSDGDYIHIYALGGEHAMIRERMHEMERRISGRYFVRISRSVLVNFDHVTEIKPLSRGTYEFMLPNGKCFSSGKTYGSEIRTLLSRVQGNLQSER